MRWQDLDLDKYYTYADYLTWQLKERVELIHGRILPMSPAPNVQHQRVSRQLFLWFGNQLSGKTCEVFHAPFDVRLPLPPDKKKNNEIDTVVQPDITVVCDPSKLDRAGCLGAPDLVIEILSPGNSRKEVKDKFELYQFAKIPEYWIVHPEEQTLMRYILDENNCYVPSRLFTRGDQVPVHLLQDALLDLDLIFEDR